MLKTIRIPKSKNKRFKALKILIISIMLFVMGIAIFFLLDKNKHTLSCSSPESINNFFSGAQGITIKHNPKTYKIPPTLYWKRKDSEPFVAYTGQNISVIFFEDTSLEQVKNVFEIDITSKFIKNNYIKNELNSYSSSYDLSGGKQKINKLAFQYRDNVYIVSYYQVYNMNTLTFTSDITATIECGNIDDPQLNDIYDQLIPVIKNDYELTPTDSILIDKIVNDEYLEILFPSVLRGRGAKVGYLKKDSTWIKIWDYENGSDGFHPLCTVLEQNNTPPGITCYDPFLGEGKSFRKTK